MVTKIISSVLRGINAQIVEIEVDVQNGLPSIIIVGLPDTIIKEAKERVISAIKNSGFTIPPRKIVINLAPAGLKKVGTQLDLPIAIGILSATNQIESDILTNFVYHGELALNGDLRPINGCLPIALKTKEEGYKNLIIPNLNINEAKIVSKINIYQIKNLLEVIELLNNFDNFTPYQSNDDTINIRCDYPFDFNEVKGQQSVKRAAEIACAGGHNFLMIGPPGSGKSMIAKRLVTILPKLTFDEAIETTKIYSILGLLNLKEGIVLRRPFRSPHHTASDASITGGGSYPKPGEISLAHNGVLFFDELPEFKKNVLQVLRQPLEDRKITIARSEGSLTFPANVMFVGAMNPCECGYLTHPDIQCTCNAKKIRNYLSRISGPILDRIDIHIEVPKLNNDEMVKHNKEESSEDKRNRVQIARDIQTKRYFKDRIHNNSQMEKNLIEKYCKLNDASKKLIRVAIDKYGLSMRAYHRILKVSRTIADLDQRDILLESDLMEALQYRGLKIFHSIN